MRLTDSPSRRRLRDRGPGDARRRDARRRGARRRARGDARRDSGRIAGTYVDATPRFHGFVREPNGAVATIDFPGANDTAVYGTGNRGQLAGARREGPDFIFRGFVSDGGDFTTVEVPGARGGDAGVNDVDDRGGLVGDYDFVISGYLRDERGRYATFYAPGAAGSTTPYGLDSRGRIVGSYYRADGRHGFLRNSRGRFKTIDFLSANETEAVRINDHGQVVGIYYEGGERVRSFLLEHGRFTTIDVPGATSTFATDIDNSGRIAGRYVDTGGAIHGFLRDRRGEFTDIDVPGAATTAVLALNDRGDTAGYFVDAGGALRGFRRDQDGTVTIIDPPLRCPGRSGWCPSLGARRRRYGCLPPVAR
jgi:hypothetical protein